MYGQGCEYKVGRNEVDQHDVGSTDSQTPLQTGQDENEPLEAGHQ
jgi:hypothetical protein